MQTRRWRLALLACALALAGCTVGLGGGDTVAPTADTPNATEPAPPSGDEASTGDRLTPVSLENSSLDLPADRILDDLEAMLDADVDAPPVEVIEGRPETADANDTGSGTVYFAQTPYRFAGHLALDDLGVRSNASQVDGGLAAGQTNQFGSVQLRLANATRAQQVTLLVHEYVHVIQVRSGMLPWSLQELLGDMPTDEAQAKWALTEGAAVWATDEYIDAHMPANTTRQSAEMARAYENARVGTRFAIARYHLGSTGVDRLLDEPNQLRDLYSDPVPNTTEQVIHGYRPTEEPMDPIAVNASGGGEWTITDTHDEDRMGELVVRVALSKELSLNRSAAAAAGWGYDRLVTYERDDTAGFAWVTRWDDAANATEFASAVETYADRRDTGEDLAFGVDRPGDEVVVVASGPPAFVERVSATVDDETVSVQVGGSG